MKVRKNISTKFKQAHDKVRVDMGLTADNLKIVRFTNWVEEGNLRNRLLKGVLLFFLLLYRSVAYIGIISPRFMISNPVDVDLSFCSTKISPSTFRFLFVGGVKDDIVFNLQNFSFLLV